MKTGLLLGAGFSYELGMPLVRELTEELFWYFSRECLGRLNEKWRQRGSGFPPERIEQLRKFMEISGQHYESVLGHLESEDYLERTQRDGRPQGLKSIFSDLISRFLIGRHIVLQQRITEGLAFYDGLLGLARESTPLWVFSLNHDMVVECAATRLNIPVSAGFSEERVRILRVPDRAGHVRHIDAEVIRESGLQRGYLDFHRHGEFGINILKLHGSLDTFTFNDGKDVLRILPSDESPSGAIEVLRQLAQELAPDPDFPFPAPPDELVAVLGDGTGVFLRRTLVSGAHKFDKRHHQVLPHEYLRFFESSLLHIDSLICIGYGFGDIHVNLKVREWLELSRQKHLTIVDPFSKSVPPTLLHLADRVTCKKMSTTEFLMQYTTTSATPADIERKQSRDKFFKQINTLEPRGGIWLLWDDPVVQRALAEWDSQTPRGAAALLGLMRRVVLARLRTQAQALEQVAQATDTRVMRLENRLREISFAQLLRARRRGG